MLFWALSFFSGIRSLDLTRFMLVLNSKAIDFRANLPPYQVEPFDAEAERLVYGKTGRKLVRWRRCQLYCLIAGALTLMLWRIAAAYPDFNPLGFP